VLERIHGVMKPKSLLFVGHSENFTDSKDLFRLRGKTVYERVRAWLDLHRRRTPIAARPCP
jgi:chemotaxis methyl-accepting protein methylase